MRVTRHRLQSDATFGKAKGRGGTDRDGEKETEREKREREREREIWRDGERRSEKMQSPRHKSAISCRCDARFSVTDRSVNQLVEVEMNHTLPGNNGKSVQAVARIVTVAVAAVIRVGG